MLVGYARTSTVEQAAGLEAQLRELRALGCDKVFHEQTSSVGLRHGLDDALEFVREGDTLVVTRLDRLARSVVHLGQIVDRLRERHVALRILDLGIDTGSATGELVLNLMGAIAQFERKLMLERQREGIAKAKSEGRYKGRKPTARAKGDQVKALQAKGLSMGAIATRLGIGKGSVHRILNEASA
jgi:DNA invertase Pin-like site-specific DNA recombinase